MIRKLTKMVIFCWACCFSLGLCKIEWKEPNWLGQKITKKKTCISSTSEGSSGHGGSSDGGSGRGGGDGGCGRWSVAVS